MKGNTSIELIKRNLKAIMEKNYKHYHFHIYNNRITALDERGDLYSLYKNKFEEIEFYKVVEGLNLEIFKEFKDKSIYKSPFGVYLIDFEGTQKNLILTKNQTLLPEEKIYDILKGEKEKLFGEFLSYYDENIREKEIKELGKNQLYKQLDLIDIINRTKSEKIRNAQKILKGVEILGIIPSLHYGASEIRYVPGNSYTNGGLIISFGTSVIKSPLKM